MEVQTAIHQFQSVDQLARSPGCGRNRRARNLHGDRCRLNRGCGAPKWLVRVYSGRGGGPIFYDSDRRAGRGLVSRDHPGDESLAARQF